MKYSQFTAMWAITVASLRSIVRSPSAVVFSFVFPFVFILVFGFIGNSGNIQNFRVVLEKGTDTTNALYAALKNTEGVKIVSYPSAEDMQLDMQKGKIAGIMNILKNDTGAIPYRVEMRSTT